MDQTCHAKLYAIMVSNREFLINATVGGVARGCGRFCKPAWQGPLFECVFAYTNWPLVNVRHVFFRAFSDPGCRYVNKKRQAAQAVGMNICVECLQPTMSESDLQARVQQRAADPHVDGIIVQLPLPRQINRRRILDAVPPQKDVDGLSTHSLALLRRRADRARWLAAVCAGAPAAVLHVLRATGAGAGAARYVIKCNERRRDVFVYSY